MKKNILDWIWRQPLLIQIYPVIVLLLILTAGSVAYLEVQEEKNLLFKGVEKEGVVYVLGLQREFNGLPLKGKSNEEIIIALQERLKKSLKHRSITSFSVAHLFLLDKSMQVIASTEQDHVLTKHEDQDIRQVIDSGEIYIGEIEENYFDPIHRIHAPITDLIAPLYVEHEIFGAIELEMDVSKTLQMLSEQYRDVFIKDTIIILIASLIFFFLVHLLLRRFLVEPLYLIEDRMRSLAHSSLDYEESKSSRNELVTLSNIFDQMKSELLIQMEELGKKKELEKELKIAQEIQKKLLPDVPPDISGYETFGMNISCIDIGGDYFDFIPLKNNRYGIVIGDVSGHGVGAALLMATARSTLRGLLVDSDTSTGNLVTDLNVVFEKDVTPGNFMTMVYGVLEPSTGEYSYTNAGHVLPLIYNPTDDCFRELESHGTMVGIFDDSTYEEGKATLKQGEILILSTDGIVEQPREEDGDIEYFSQERFETIIRDSASLSLDLIAEEIKEKLYRFALKENFNDDVTLVMVRRL